MPDMPPLRDILNDTAADAIDVDWNFNTIETHVNNDLVMGTPNLADGAVTTAKIANLNVTLAKMAANSVDSDQYVDASIDTEHFSATARPWAVSWGVIARAEKTVSQSITITEAADVTNLTATWTAVSGRLYRVYADLRCGQQGSNSLVNAVWIATAANVQQGQSRGHTAGGTDSYPLRVEAFLTGSGSVTHKARVSVYNGTMVVLSGLFVVEDVGPA